MRALGGYLFKILHPTQKKRKRKKKVAYTDSNFIRVQNNYVSLNKLKIKK